MITKNLSAALLAILFAVATSADAATVFHGDFPAATVEYDNVTESSTTDPGPLFGTPVTIGDTLSFFEPGSHPNPSVGFGANAPPSDVTDGFLSFAISAKSGYGISAVEISEGGDYSMSALQGELAQVNANLIVQEVAITHVDGLAITPIVVNSLDSATFDFPGDPSPGLWDLSHSFVINQILTDAGMPFVLGATRLTVKVDNTLHALATSGAVASIVKKDFDVNVSTNEIPEPASLGLLVIGLGFVCGRRSAR